MKNEKIEELMAVPMEYESISIPKLSISKEIKNGLSNKGISIRKLAENIGMKHPQIVRVTSAENYNIDTLLKILDGLDLEVVIKKKNKA